MLGGEPFHPGGDAGVDRVFTVEIGAALPGVEIVPKVRSIQGVERYVIVSKQLDHL